MSTDGAIFAAYLPRIASLIYLRLLLPYRAAFLSFCNHSESRCIFVHIVRAGRTDGEVIQVSSSPPPFLDNKAMVFLKCSHSSKLSRENLAQDVMYTGNGNTEPPTR